MGGRPSHFPTEVMVAQRAGLCVLGRSVGCRLRHLLPLLPLTVGFDLPQRSRGMRGERGATRMRTREEATGSGVSPRGLVSGKIAGKITGAIQKKRRLR